MSRQVYNPFLPLNEYIPDGEPHVWGDRVYHYGSHDKEGGYTFCMQDYVVYSAPVKDLKDWRCEGVTYRASQDPAYPELKYMYAPDVVRGNDGRYYLYYCMGGDYGYGGYTGPISVAVCDTPAGKYEYLGHVHYKDGTVMKKYICFDPAAMNDDGTIRIFYGTQYGYEEEPDFLTNGRLDDEVSMFGRTKEEILSYKDSIMGPIMVVLEDDMLTVKEEPRHIIPYAVKGTTFEEHPFFEGSSMRKVGDKYYFVYSSWQNHELCYAVSDYPDHGFTFGGTIVSNGDVGYKGRAFEDKLNMTGTTHGSIECIDGQWYVFYHRLTHKSDYSRQACAEKIYIAADGHIDQVEVTSCGLNYGPLAADGEYPAVIACNLTNGHMPHGSNSIYTTEFPNVTNKGEDRFIAEIEDGTLIGYKYFALEGSSTFGVNVRYETDANKVVYDGPVRIDERCESSENVEDSNGSAENESASPDESSDNKADSSDDKMSPSYDIHAQGYFDICVTENGESIGRIDIPLSDDTLETEWRWCENKVDFPEGVHAVYLVYRGKQKTQLKDIRFS